MARVLIIDDDLEIVALLAEILKQAGHEVFSAGEPVSGMQMARKAEPDLIVLDYHMPGNTGAHLFESLRRNNATRHTPILFMSGEADPARIMSEVSDQTGARFLPKPVKLEDFRRAIREMLAEPQEASRTGKLILLRHGQSLWNLENRFTGWVDVPITALGEQEAHRAGRELMGIRFDRAFVSELKRANQTLEIILDDLGQKNIPIEKDKALNERHYGDLQGLNKAETKDKFGERQVHIWRRSFDVKPPNGESLRDTADRTVPYFRQSILPVAAAGKNVLVSAHGNSLRAIVMNLEGLTPEQIMTVNIETCRPICYDIGPMGGVIAKTVSESSSNS